MNKPTERNSWMDPGGREKARSCNSFVTGKYLGRMPNSSIREAMIIKRVAEFNILMCVFSSNRLKEGLKMNEKKFNKKEIVVIDIEIKTEVIEISGDFQDNHSSDF